MWFRGSAKPNKMVLTLIKEIGIDVKVIKLINVGNVYFS